VGSFSRKKRRHPYKRCNDDNLRLKCRRGTKIDRSRAEPSYIANMMAINTFSLPDGKMKTRLNIGNIYKKEALFVINAVESPQLQMKARQSRHELNPHLSFISSFLFFSFLFFSSRCLSLFFLFSFLFFSFFPSYNLT